MKPLDFDNLPIGSKLAMIADKSTQAIKTTKNHIKITREKSPTFHKNEGKEMFCLPSLWELQDRESNEGDK